MRRVWAEGPHAEEPETATHLQEKENLANRMTLLLTHQLFLT